MRKLLLILVVIISGCSSDENNNVEPQQFPSNVTSSLEHQGNERVYILHIPPTYDGLSKVPLVITLHGGSGTAQSAVNFTQMNPVSDENGFLALYPQAFATQGQGYSWADGRNTAGTQLGIDDVGFIQKLIVRLSSEYRIDSDSIYINGFSNGGFMTQKLACELPNSFAAIGTLGATIGADVLDSCSTPQSIPTLIMMGDADPLVPYKGGTVSGNSSEIASVDDLVGFWKNNNQCQSEMSEQNLPNTNTSDNSTVTLFEFSECDCGANVRLYRINNGGHTWPGVENKVYELIAGETNEDIDASEVLWNFFDRYQLCE